MKRSNDAIVGLVVLATIAALIGAMVWVRQADVGQRQHEVVAHFRDVGNARVGNSVVIRGVIGGRIQAIELASNGWVNVRMKLDPAVTLPSSPVVLLNESSLFGDWQATVVERGALPHDDELRREVMEASGESGMLPGATLPGIGKLTAVAGQIAGDVANVAARFGSAFDEQAANELHASIRNVAGLSSTLRSVAELHASDVDSLALQVRTAALSLNRTAASVELTARRLDSVATSSDAKELIQNVSVASGELRRAAAQVRDLTTRFAATQGRVDAFLISGDSVLGKINHGQGSLGLFVNDPSLYRRSDSAVSELRALTADIRTNPRKYLTIRIF